MREQFWVVPGADDAFPLRATLFRPLNAEGRQLPLVIINHGTDDNTRLSVSMPVYYWLSRWFVDRGYAVLLPQRRGHGATGGPLAEAPDSCISPDHANAGMAAAADIAAAIRYIRQQPFIDPTRIISAGISTGGWASLALSAHHPDLISAVINFAGGRGGHAFGRKRAICDGAQLIAASAAFGATSRVPTVWYYAENDSYFAPALATQLAAAWKTSGGNVELNVLEAYRSEGHGLVDDHAGWQLWGANLDGFLTRHGLSDACRDDSLREHHLATDRDDGLVTRDADNLDTCPFEDGHLEVHATKTVPQIESHTNIERQ